MAPKEKLDLSKLRNKNNLSEFEAESKRDQVIMLWPHEIEAPKQVRTKFFNIEQLRATIDSDGQDNPIGVGPKNKNGKYPLLKGGRRYRAALLEPVIQLRAIIKVDAASVPEDKAILSQIIENDQRDNLLPHEIGRGYRDAQLAAKARGEKLTGRDIAKYVGRREEFVSLHLSIADIPDSLVELIETRVCKDATVLASMRTLYDIDRSIYEVVLAEAKEKQSLERQAVREAIKRAKGIPETPPAPTPALPAADGGAPAQANGVIPETASTNDVAKNTASTEALPPPGAGAQTESTPGTDGAANDEGTAPVSDEKLVHAQTLPLENTTEHVNGAVTDILDKGAAKKVVHAAPDQLIIFVRVSFEAAAKNGQKIDVAVKNGQLMTDRVCTDPNKVWVNVVDTNGTATSKLVAADDVQIVSISKRA